MQNFGFNVSDPLDMPKKSLAALIHSVNAKDGLIPLGVRDSTRAFMAQNGATGIKINSSVDRDLERVHIKAQVKHGGRLHMISRAADTSSLIGADINSLNTDEWIEQCGANLELTLYAEILGIKEPVMTDLTNIAKEMARNKARGTTGSKSGAVAKLTVKEWKPLIMEAYATEKKIKALDPSYKVTVAEVLRDGPSLTMQAWISLKGGQDFPIPQEDLNPTVGNFRSISQMFHNHLKDAEERAAERRRKERDEWITVQSEQGEFFIQRWRWQLIEGYVGRGVSCLLKGPPGTGKTDIGRAVAKVDNRTFFHMEVSGFTDVSQLEYERIITSKDGAAHMEMRPTPFTEALEAVERGERVLLFVDEIKRVADPSILNPWLLLLAQGEYHSVVTKKVYRVNADNFVMFASANDAEGYNFSGNSRRGMDDAMADRFSEIEMPLLPANKLGPVLAMRTKCSDEIAVAVAALFHIAQKDEDMRRVFGVRAAMKTARDWMILGSEWELMDILARKSPFTQEQLAQVEKQLAAAGV